MRLPSHLCRSFIDSWLKDGNGHIYFFSRLECTAGFCFKFIKVEKTVYVGTGCQACWKTAAWHLQVVRRAEAAASSHLQNSDGKSFERNRQNNTVIFPLLFQVSKIVVIPVTHI